MMFKYRPRKNKILVAMAKKGFNQKTLSETANLNPSTVSIFLNKRRSVSPTSARKIADALDCDINKIFEVEINDNKTES